METIGRLQGFGSPVFHHTENQTISELSGGEIPAGYPSIRLRLGIYWGETRTTEGLCKACMGETAHLKFP